MNDGLRGVAKHVMAARGGLGPIVMAALLPGTAPAHRHGIAHWLLLARVQTERGLLVAAERDYRRGHVLRPRATVFAIAQYFTR
jgi:hypothetical protein